MTRRFRGEIVQKVDGKGRVSIPASFRRVLEQGDPDWTEGLRPELVLAYGGQSQKYIEGYTVQAMEDIENAIESMWTNPYYVLISLVEKTRPIIRAYKISDDKNVEEIIKDVKNGYYISNMKIPSIDMKRYNWSISCQYAQKIENGELTDLLRDVIVMGTAPEFFNSIDACGNDFTVRPITNCGKGDPMQSMIMGNGGPTIRGTATVKSVS